MTRWRSMRTTCTSSVPSISAPNTDRPIQAPRGKLTGVGAGSSLPGAELTTGWRAASSAIALADARELALVAVGEHLAAAVLARVRLAGLLGLGLRVLRGDHLAVLLLDVPALAAGDDVHVWHAPRATHTRGAATPDAVSINLGIERPCVWVRGRFRAGQRRPAHHPTRRPPWLQSP